MEKSIVVFILLVMTLTLSCSPKKGDVYENKLDRNRVQVVSAGNCFEIHSQAKWEVDKWNYVDMKDVGIIKSLSPYILTSYDSLNWKGEKCIRIEQKSDKRNSVYGVVINTTTYSNSILKRDYFNQNYTKVK